MSQTECPYRFTCELGCNKKIELAKLIIKGGKVLIGCLMCSMTFMQSVRAELRSTQLRNDPAVKQRLAYARSLRKEKGPKIGDIAKQCIRQGMSFEDTLLAVKALRPDAQMKRASYNWYKLHLND